MGILSVLVVGVVYAQPYVLGSQTLCPSTLCRQFVVHVCFEFRCTFVLIPVDPRTAPRFQALLKCLCLLHSLDALVPETSGTLRLKAVHHEPLA